MLIVTNWMKRKILMLKLAFTFFNSNGGGKRAEIIKKSGLFYAFGENNYWHPNKIPADLSVVSIGSNVTVCADVDFVTHDLAFLLFNQSSYFDTSRNRAKYYFDKIVVDDDVMIGAHSVIMYGVHIKSNSIIAAGSVVTKDVESGTIVGGNPARIIGETAKLFEKRMKLQEDRDFGNNDIEAINRYFWSDKK